MKNKQEFVDGLIATKKVFNKHGIFFWLEAGTLIGAMREGKILQWDKDVDISTWVKDIIKIAKTQDDFHALGYEIILCNGHYVLRDLKTKKILVDIFSNENIKGHLVKLFFFPYMPLKYFIWMLSEPDYLNRDYQNFDLYCYHAYLIPRSLRKIMINITDKLQAEKRRNLIIFLWKLTIKFKLYSDEFVRSKTEVINNFTKIEFYGEEFDIPEKYDEYLTFRFKNWRIPLKGFKGRGKRIKLKDIWSMVE